MRVFQELNQEEVLIYPNPVNADLYITLAEGSGGADVKLFDSVGREVLANTLKEGKSMLDLSKVNEGIYILKIFSLGKEVNTARIVVK